MEGVDYAFGWRAGLGAELVAAGKQFVCRYLSGGSSKDLTAAERDDLHGAGLAIVVVWETDGKSGPLEGAAGGQRDGLAAVAQARGLGAPPGTCIYFAVDFDAGSANFSALQAYFSSARSACNASGYRCGDYGGIHTVSGVPTDVDMAWQTYAWSGGQWDGSANLEQYQNGVSLCGITVDLDRAITADFGQWESADMSDETLDAIAAAIIYEAGYVDDLNREPESDATLETSWAAPLASAFKVGRHAVEPVLQSFTETQEGQANLNTRRGLAARVAALEATVAKLQGGTTTAAVESDIAHKLGG